MKVFFDCIVTKDPPNQCSTTVQFMRVAALLLKNPDVFIYWPIPEFVTDLTGYPVSDQIKYFRVFQTPDRTREYNLIRPWLESALSFTGDHWDWDVMLTVRTQQVPFMKIMSLSPRQQRRGWSKKIVLIEEMPILSEKLTVAKSQPDIQDRMAIEGYLAADRVFSPSYHEKDMMLAVAKDHFTPARQMELRKKIKEVCGLSTGVFELKDKFMWNPDCGRKMNLAFVGRLEIAAARLEVINSVMVNQFILHGDKVKPVVLSISDPGAKAEKVLDKSAIEVLHLQREAFWKMAREELDLGVYFHVDGGLLMSIFEPVSFGMPAIVKDAKWSRSVFGPDYPLYAKTETEAYGLVSAFVNDYARMYELFKAWHQNWFVPEYTRRLEKDGLYDNVARALLEDPEIDKATLPAMKSNAIVQLIAKHGGAEFKLLELIKDMGKEHLNSLSSKIGEKHDDRGLVWGTPWNEFRLALKFFHGYEDASPELGHLKKKST